MNLYLKNIEQNIEEKLWLQGESLFDTEGTFKKTTKISKTLWNIVLNDGTDYEVEILLRSNKPKFTCECDEFYEAGNCKHIVASLIHIKEEISSQELARDKAKAKENLRKAREAKYNVKSILEKAHPEELKRFVRAYANMENSFSLALKGHFANKMDLENNNQKYKQLLDAAVKPKNFKHLNLSTTEKKDFYRLVDSLSSQAEDCITLKQFRECKYIIMHVIDKIFYIRKSYNHNPKRLELKEVVILKFLSELLEEKMPPELKTEIYGDVLELINRSYFVPADKNIIESVVANLDFQADDVATFIDKLIPTINDKNETNFNFLACCLYLYPKHKFVLEKIVSEVRIEKLIPTLQHLHKLGNIPLLILILDGLKKQKVEAKQINILACKIFFESKLIKKGLPYLNGMLRDDKDNSLAIGMVNFIEEETREEFLDELNKIFKDTEQYDLLRFYKNTQQLEKIAEELKGGADLSLLWEYDGLLLDLGEEQLYDLYLETSKAHLNNYIGAAGRDAILTSLNRLNNLGLKKMRRKLQDEIKSEFSHRKIIADISKL